MSWRERVKEIQVSEIEAGYEPPGAYDTRWPNMLG